ncbi:hypothetical protein EST38_g14128 [Candolleomyces aberdarensis]|uniref:Uncharacterized protein n=1 Tax=Candolleomyces aberdarensis TaxID=2316362 RepID=A0A4Q2CY34_9AGAR|nr:hypothetical protein EST38_g14128 [Candolleomyces aberdarensis]
MELQREQCPNNFEPTGPDPSATYAGQNPHKKTIPVREQGRVSEAHKNTLQIRREVAREKAEAFAGDLKVLMDGQKEKVEELALKHSKSAEHVKGIVMAETHYKQKRKTNLQNARVHRKRLELNKGRAPGQRATLEEIQAAVREDEDLQNMSSGEEDALRQEHDEYRTLKKKGARINNKAATLDAAHVFQHVDEEINLLYERTGTVAFAFFSHGNVNDTSVPGFVSSGNAIQFCYEVFKMSPVQVLQQFELFACTLDSQDVPSGKNQAETLESLQKQAQKLILDGLISASKDKYIKMSYERYKEDIMVKLKLQLRGWPAGVPFVPPGKITRVDQVRDLRDALLVGDCIWSPLTHLEVAAAEEEVQQAPKKKRKTRSDAGKKRGPRKKDMKKSTMQAGDESEEAEFSSEECEGSLRKRARRAKDVAAMLPPSVIKSAEFIENSDED